MTSRSVILVGLILCAAAPVQAAAPSAADAEFFEKQVRPILVQHCYSCHSHAGKKMRGGLALDSRSGWEKGGDSGPAVVPGKPDKSLLIKAVQHTSDLKMPREKLGETQIKTLVEWVNRGAPDPRVLAKVADPMDWWSLKPLAKPAVPAGAGHPIDAFLQAQLKTHKLTPAPQADRRTLLRRVKFDLHGLPPTAEEIEAFIADSDPSAYEKMIDRLLASPHYGERWARHWLDVIRYGDSRGNEHDGFREHAWRYRDYVIEAINADLPYDQFIHEQLAADAFFPTDVKRLAALGFLAAGPDVLSGSEYTVRDEFITTAMSAFVSSTVQCARCHNHKFDPISLEDYYGLQAVFAGVNRRDVLVDLDPTAQATRTKWLGIKAAAGSKGNPTSLVTTENKSLIGGWEQALGEKGPLWKTLQFVQIRTESGAKLEVRKDGALVLAKAVAETDTYTLTIAGPIENAKVLRLELLADAGLPKGGPGLTEDGSAAISELEIQAFTSKADKGRRIGFKSSQADVFSKDRPVNRAHDNKLDTFWAVGPGASVAVFDLGNAPTITSEGRLEIVLRQKQAKQLLGCFRFSLSDKPTNPYTFVPTAVSQAMAVPAAKRTDKDWQTLALHCLPIVADEAIARMPVQTSYHVVAGSLPHEGKMGTPKSVNIMLRGDGGRSLGQATPGAISSITALKGRLAPSDSKDDPSRRKYLAQWISDPANPLTSRSIVNRVWHHHFGRGIVDTVNDFGRMGATPSHPELLDWLAVEFRDNGMSLKRLHRLILTSDAYRQAVVANPQAEALDAENRLLWRMNRIRLDAESYRDSVLAISGRLDTRMGGPGVLQFEVKPGFNTTKLANYDAIDWSADGPNRRSVYRFIFRTRPDPFMSAMDFPDASQFVPSRSFSASPLQALVLFNNHFVLHHSDQLARRIERDHAEARSQVRAAFRLALQREPDPQESSAFTNYANRHGLAATCRLLLNSNEFLFLE